MYSYMEFILLSDEGRGEGRWYSRCENSNLHFFFLSCDENAKLEFLGGFQRGFFFRIRINLLTGHPFSTAQRDFAEMGIASSDMLRDFLIEIFFLLQLTNLEKKFALILF